MPIMKNHEGIAPMNPLAWAIGHVSNGGKGRFYVRRVVWGRLLARAERRDNEQIRRAYILVANMKGRQK
jgi:hypothetical protein